VSPSASVSLWASVTRSVWATDSGWQFASVSPSVLASGWRSGSESDSASDSASRSVFRMDYSSDW